MYWQSPTLADLDHVNDDLGTMAKPCLCLGCSLHVRKPLKPIASSIDGGNGKKREKDRTAKKDGEEDEGEDLAAEEDGEGGEDLAAEEDDEGEEDLAAEEAC